MWKRLTLRTRLFVILGAMVVITLSGGSVMVWYTLQIGNLFKDVVYVDLKILETAEGLENALVHQKGFVSYYFQDGDIGWLEKLGAYRNTFQNRLEKARELVVTEKGKATVNAIETEYSEYIKNKDQVISLYKAGQRKQGFALHKKVREHFFKILELCENFKERSRKSIEKTRAETEAQAKRLRIIAGTAIWTVVLLGAMLAFVLVHQILNPLRQLVNEGAKNGGTVNENEVKAISKRVHTLEDVIGETRSELERSQEHLQQAEKLAMVGRLAAGMAHSIRNPLTSLKMRLFSLGRSLEMSSIQKEDFSVISEEIRHLDNIVRNFLEFSRPPKLKKQVITPSTVVDMALQLLRHRLDSYSARVTHQENEKLPRISVDPEQLKEVIVNLLVNACEATGGPLNIKIAEEEKVMKPWGRAVLISVTDNGPGIAKDIQSRLFDPFFSTKEEGTGLGLSISARILREHGGALQVRSREKEGTTFTLILPVGEDNLEHDLDHR